MQSSGVPRHRRNLASPATAWAVTFVLSSAVRTASAEVYRFSRDPAPEAKSMQSLYTFYTFAGEDALRLGGESVVTFETSMDWDEGNDASSAKDYKGVQLTLLNYEDWSSIDSTRFCCQDQDVDDGRCSAKEQLNLKHPMRAITHTVQSPADSRQMGADGKAFTLPSTGVYVLLMSNCGEKSGATISGTVSVRSPYGYLPGDEYNKMKLYTLLTPVYAILAVMWVARGACRDEVEVGTIRRSVACLLTTGLVEALFSYVYYARWNETGLDSHGLSFIAIIASTGSAFLSYTMLLATALASVVGSDMYYLSIAGGFAVVFVTIDAGRDMVLLYLRDQALPSPIVFLCLFPVLVPSALAGIGVFTSFGWTVHALERSKQQDSARRYWRSQWLLLTTHIIGAWAMLYQIRLLTQHANARWRYQWLLCDAMSHLLNISVSIALMHIWTPGAQAPSLSRYKEDKDAQDDSPEIDAHRTLPKLLPMVGASMLALVLINGLGMLMD